MKPHPPLGTTLFTSTWEEDEIAPVARSPFVVWLPDGRVCTTKMPSYGVIQVQDLRTGQEVQRFEGHQQQALEALPPVPSRRTLPAVQTLWSPDRRLIASEFLGDRKRVWEVASGKEVESAWSSGLPSSERWEIDAWSPDSRLFASCQPKKHATVKIYELASGRFIGHQPIDNLCSIGSMAWSPDGQWIVTMSRGVIGDPQDPPNRLKLWEAATGRFLVGLPPNGVEWVTNLAWSPDGHLFAHTSESVSLSLNEMPSGNYRRSYKVRGKLADMLKWSPDGRFIAFSTRGYFHYQECSMISIWEVATGEIGFIYHGHEEREQGLEPGLKLVTEVRQGKKGEIVEQHFSPLWSSHIQDLAWSPDGKQIASVSTFWLTQPKPHSAITDIKIWQAEED